jgi:capsular polysaccharide biosynthesis protein
LALITDIGAAPIGPLADALETTNAARVVLCGKEDAPTASQLIWPPETEAMGQPHAGPFHQSDIAAYIVRNATLKGRGASPMQDGAYLYAADILPSYLEAFIANDIKVEDWGNLDGRERLSIPIGFSLIHYNLVYGHWLLEMFPKLFAIKMIMEQGVLAPIILPTTTPPYVRNFISLVLPAATIQYFDPFAQHMMVDRLICPSMFNVHYHYNPVINDHIDQLCRECLADPQMQPTGLGSMLNKLFNRSRSTAEGNPKHIFVSRVGLAPSYRTLGNQAEIEQIARSQGLRIVKPELLDIAEQIALFSNADLIVGEFGSGMHNALFAPKSCKVFCLNWISDVQSHIANLRGQEIGYLLADDAKPRTFQFQEVTDEYRIDPLAFAERLNYLSSRSRIPSAR